MSNLLTLMTQLSYIFFFFLDDSQPTYRQHSTLTSYILELKKQLGLSDSKEFFKLFVSFHPVPLQALDVSKKSCRRPPTQQQRVETDPGEVKHGCIKKCF